MGRHQTFFKSDMPVRVRPKNRTISRARKARRRLSEAEKVAVYARVDERDWLKSRASGIYVGLAGDPRGARHHIVYRSQGGKHETGNVVTLTTEEHERVHAHKLAVEGNADETLTFIDLTNGKTWESKCPT